MNVYGVVRPFSVAFIPFMLIILPILLLVNTILKLPSPERFQSLGAPRVVNPVADFDVYVVMAPVTDAPVAADAPPVAD